MVKPTTPSSTVVIELQPLNIHELQIILVGDSQLVTHPWSEKAKKEMLGVMTGQSKTRKRDPKNPQQEYEASRYVLPDGQFGFPSVAFKSAAVSAARQVDGLQMTFLRGAFHVMGDYVIIEGTPEPREDMVRVGMGKPDIRYRAEFKDWRVTLNIRYNAGAISAEQIINLFNIAGFSVGVGEYRPERRGNWGMFHVAAQNE